LTVRGEVADHVAKLPHPAKSQGQVAGCRISPHEEYDGYSGSTVDDGQIEWIVNGSVVGTSADLYYSSSSSFTLEVHYWNDVSGADATATQAVTVSEGVGQCYDQ
jgi:hypothetical protein